MLHKEAQLSTLLPAELLPGHPGVPWDGPAIDVEKHGLDISQRKQVVVEPAKRLEIDRIADVAAIHCLEVRVPFAVLPPPSERGQTPY